MNLSLFGAILFTVAMLALAVQQWRQNRKREFTAWEKRKIKIIRWLVFLFLLVEGVVLFFIFKEY